MFSGDTVPHFDIELSQDAIKALRRDPLERRFDRGAPTYWVRHNPAGRIERYLRQF